MGITHVRSAKRNAPKRQKPKQTFTVRAAKDYPWVVLNALRKALSHSINPDFNRKLKTIIERRSLEDYIQLGDLWGLQSIDPANLEGSSTCIASQLMLCSVIKKFTFASDQEVLTQRALSAFHEAELSCSDFNRQRRKIIERSSDPILLAARDWVASVIGTSLPGWEDLTESARHGPGTSVGNSYVMADKYFKYSNWPYTVTRRCLPHARKLIQSDARWCNAIEAERRRDGKPFLGSELSDDYFDVVIGNRVTTVPKDARKRRPIAIEPTLNVMLQLGVDGVIRRRLKRWGIDLDHQDKNQQLAYIGTIYPGGLTPATIDLASASDTISLGIAKYLLPPAWWEYLCDIRSPKGTLPDGTKVRYSKLSSMGNGYTFAIESLLFAAINYACCKHVLGRYPREWVSVFGDDIVTPELVAPITVRYLELVGFSVNLEKSFLEGSVKESCGSDWVVGTPVRPVHLKDTPQFVDELFNDRNRLRRWFYIHDHVDSWPEVDSVLQTWLPSWARSYTGPCSDTEFTSWLHESNPADELSDGSYGTRKTVQTFLKDRKIPRTEWQSLRTDLRPSRPKEPWRSKVGTRTSEMDLVPLGESKFRLRSRRRHWLWPTAYTPPKELVFARTTL